MSCCGIQVGRHTSNIIESTNYLLELVLIHDDETISVSRPLDGSVIFLTFSIQHYSELRVETKKEC